MKKHLLIALLLLLSLPVWCADRAVILKASEGFTCCEAIARSLEKRGIDCEITSSPAGLAWADVCIIAGADKAASDVRDAVMSRLERKGRVLFLGGPAFGRAGIKFAGRELSRSELAQAAADVPGETLMKADSRSVDSFIRCTNDESVRASYSAVSTEPVGNAVYVDMDDMTGWESFAYRPEKQYKGDALCFMARGDEQTTGLYIELTETSGVRWFSSVKITQDWQQLMLVPSDFRWWHDGAKAQGEFPDFSQIYQLNMGFALSGMPTPPGHHSYYVSDVEIKDLGLDHGDFRQVSLDGISPASEVYPVTNGAALSTCENQIFVKDRRYTLPSDCISCSPGRQGTGYGMARTSRFVPLIEITDKEGLHSGYGAWLNMYYSYAGKNGPLEGSITGCFAANSMDFYDENGTEAVADAACAMLTPAFLAEGGTEEYTFIDSAVKNYTVGAVYAPCGVSEGRLLVTTELFSKGSPIWKISSEDTPVRRHTDELLAFEAEKPNTGLRPDMAKTCLYIDGVLRDCIIQDRLNFFVPKKDPKFITARDGGFWQDGKALGIFGVNYMPSSGISEPDLHLFEDYMCRQAYDPTVIHNDLKRIKALGFNAVSVFVHANAMDSNNMADLVCQCDELGLYVDLAIRSVQGELMYFIKADADKLILKQHFNEFDNIIAYDTAWEVTVGGYLAGWFLNRKRWDNDWRQWVKDQYGSEEHAAALWKIRLPRDQAGKLIGVQDYMLDSDDPKYAPIVAAFRRFVDDMTAREYIDTYAYMKSLDKNHLFSFRMNAAGSYRRTTGNVPSAYTYDFQSLAPAVDVIEPEGYALSSENPDSMLQVLFANAYARYAAPGTPVVWKEYGRSVWEKSNFTDKTAALAGQKQYYAAVLENALAAHSAGMFCWFFPGGFRIDENSDYGIINPDGSDRPCTEVLRKYAPLFTSPASEEQEALCVAIDRDSHPSGMYREFDRALPEMRKAKAAEKLLTLTDKAENKPAHMLTLYAVGDTPAKGLYPLKYVNGMIKEARTVWQGGRKKLLVTVINTGHSVWSRNTVSVRCGTARAVIKTEVPYLGTAQVYMDYEPGPVGLWLEKPERPFGMIYRK